MKLNSDTFAIEITCPLCGTTNVQAGGTKRHDDVCWRNFSCQELGCRMEWSVKWDPGQYTPDEPTPNTNCLKGIACPECGHVEAFEINGHVWATVTDDGVTEHENFEWDAGSTCRCMKCNHRDRMDAFGSLDADTISVGCAALPDRDRRDSDKMEAGRCPVCGAGHDDLSYGSISVGGTEVMQVVNCGHCGSRFDDVYALDDRVVFEKGDLIEKCEAEQIRVAKLLRAAKSFDVHEPMVARALKELLHKGFIKPHRSGPGMYMVTEAGLSVLRECDGSDDDGPAKREPEEAQPEPDRYRRFAEVVAGMKPNIGMFFSTELRELITSAKDLTQ